MFWAGWVWGIHCDQAPKVGDPLGPGAALLQGKKRTYFKGIYLIEEGIYFVVVMIVDAHNQQCLQNVI